MPIKIATKEGMMAKKKTTAKPNKTKSKPMGRQDYQGAPMKMDAEYKSAGGMVYKGR